MAVRVREVTWRRARGLEMESELLRAVVLPEHGARIVSLIHRPSNREILWKPPELRGLPAPTYGMAYHAHPAVGIDECVPTIGVDTHDGQTLPDHGEAWSVPWDVARGRDWIETAVRLRASALYVTRRLSFTRPDALRLDYTLTNMGSAPTAALWAQHPLLRWERGMRIVLPPEVAAVRTGAVMGRCPLPPHARVPWPFAAGLDLGAAQLNTTDEPAAVKCYTAPLSARWAALHDGLQGFVVGFAFTTPALGLWLNRGAWGGYTHVALEPTTAPADLLSEAVALGSALTIPAGETATWRVTIAADSGYAQVRGVTPAGEILG